MDSVSAIEPEFAISMEDRLESSGPSVIAVNEAGRAPFALVCEHASRLLPAGYDRLGLPAAEFDRHIAWDIGAAEVATRLACLLDAPLFLAGYSRLLIDLNRPPGSPDSIVRVSENTRIPGNAAVGPEEAERRRQKWFAPFHDAVADHLNARRERATAVIGIHTFTPVFRDIARPWHAGVLFGRADAFGQHLASAIESRWQGSVGRNEPYQVTLEDDYTVPVHGDARGLAAALIEIRQDLVTDVLQVERWSRLLASALDSVASMAAPQAVR